MSGEKARAGSANQYRCLPIVAALHSDRLEDSKSAEVSILCTREKIRAKIFMSAVLSWWPATSNPT